MSSFLLVAALGAAALPLAGCDSFNRAIGKTRVIPDEFQVVSNAPLAIPPDYSLRPPRVGNGPSQANATDQAREAVFRAGDNQQPAPAPSPKMSPGQQDLLKQAGATNLPADIRQTVDADPSTGVPFERSLTDKLLFWKSSDQPAPCQYGDRPELRIRPPAPDRGQEQRGLTKPRDLGERGRRLRRHGHADLRTQHQEIRLVRLAVLALS